VKLGQPVPESNFALDEKSSVPQIVHLYTPLPCSFTRLCAGAQKRGKNALVRKRSFRGSFESEPVSIVFPYHELLGTPVFLSAFGAKKN